MCNAVNRLFQRLTYCNNRELVYDLYSYVWDMRGVVSLLNSYVKWLGELYSLHSYAKYYLICWHTIYLKNKNLYRDTAHEQRTWLYIFQLQSVALLYSCISNIVKYQIHMHIKISINTLYSCLIITFLLYIPYTEYVYRKSIWNASMLVYVISYSIIITWYIDFFHAI